MRETSLLLLGDVGSWTWSRMFKTFFGKEKYVEVSAAAVAAEVVVCVLVRFFMGRGELAFFNNASFTLTLTV
jgi:hypothetical protein